jgi:hypothetical protein
VIGTTIGGRFVVESQGGELPTGAVLYYGRAVDGGALVDIQAADGAVPPGKNPRAWLRHEAETLRRFASPHVQTLHDYADDGAQAFLVTEGTAGFRGHATLVDWMKTWTRPVPPPGLAQLGRQLLAAVAHVHERGYVHTSIHAGAVLLREDASILLAEFVHARHVRQLASSPPRGGRGAVAPEVREGQPVSPQSDLYALGTLLYHIASAGAADPAAPQPLEHLRPDLPPAAHAVIRRLLARDPATRGTAAEAASAWAAAFGARAPAAAAAAAPSAAPPRPSAPAAAPAPLAQAPPATRPGAPLPTARPVGPAPAPAPAPKPLRAASGPDDEADGDTQGYPAWNRTKAFHGSAPPGAVHPAAGRAEPPAAARGGQPPRPPSGAAPAAPAPYAADSDDAGAADGADDDAYAADSSGDDSAAGAYEDAYAAGAAGDGPVDERHGHAWLVLTALALVFTALYFILGP